MRYALLVFLSCVGFAQGPKFDAADVHVSKPGAEQNGGFIPGGRMELHSMSMIDLITLAYTVDDDMISGGPAWMGFARFDVNAKARRTTSEETMRVMLRSLLAERFQLKIHTEDRPMPAFVMTVGKHLQMKEAAGGGEGMPDCQPEQAPDSRVKITCRNITMGGLATRLHQFAGGYLNHPVVDATGLEGRYDFTLAWTGKGALGTAPGSISIFDAVDKQLGLKIEAGKRPLPAIVIDSVNQTPTPNAPGVQEGLPIAETEFEVATVRASKPDEKPNQRILPSGQLDFQAIPLKLMISFAFDMDADRIVGAPKWLDTANYDVAAKTTSVISIDGFRVMLKSLLIDRFKLAVHEEEQPMPVYEMVVAKRGAKLEKAEGTERSGCKPAMENELISYTCKNTTMAKLAEDLHRVAGGYVIHPVVDSTGLEGAYNFVLSWTPRNKLGANAAGAARPEGAPASPPAAGGGDVPVPADPSGISLFEAIDRQLGLRLDQTRKPQKVLVIDHVNQEPTDN
jgi:uncharacterized protein (TIGR03435 family)